MTKSAKSIKVIFVCMGNICRSPTAQGVFQSMVDENNLNDTIDVESAGTHSYHAGNPPDLRAQATARKNGVDLSGLKARKFLSEDFNDFDYIIGMDKHNLEDMLSIKPAQFTASTGLMLEYSSRYSQAEVPDPYYGNDGFDLVFDMVSDASAGLLEHIRKQHGL